MFVKELIKKTIHPNLSVLRPCAGFKERTSMEHLSNHFMHLTLLLKLNMFYLFLIIEEEKIIDGYTNQEGNKNKFYGYLLSVYIESFGGKWEIDTCINVKKSCLSERSVTLYFHSKNKIVLMLELKQSVIQDSRSETLVCEVC